MHNIPDMPPHVDVPWEEEEWRCPKCYGHMDDVKCRPWDEYCQEEVMSDLLPCPFCGGTDIDIEAGIFIECDNCGATGPTEHIPDAEVDPNRSADEESIAAWNTRHIADVPEHIKRELQAEEE